MSKVPMPYLTRQRDRQGRWIFYYRRKPGTPKTRLPGAPGSPEFMAAYQEAARARPARPDSGTRTWRWLCRQYLAAPELAALAPATRRQRRAVLESTWCEPVAPIDVVRAGRPG